MSTPTPALTVHHLQRGQSERIVWLLEELSLPYSLVIHKRAPLLAPESLKAVTPQGSAPVLIDESGSTSVTLSESMAIATYILGKHAPSTPQSAKVAAQLVPGPEEASYADYLYWLYFALTSIQPAQFACMIAYFDPTLTDKPDSLVKSMPRSRLQRYLSLLDARLSTHPYLAGESFTLADLMALWPIGGARTFLPYSIAPYPNVSAWVKRVTGREAYRRAMDKADHGLEIVDGAEPPGGVKAHF